MAIDVLDVVPIEELRQHIEFDGDDRDAVIKRYAQSALDYCLRWCDEPRWKVASDLPSEVISAMLLYFVMLLSTEAHKRKFSFIPTSGQGIYCFLLGTGEVVPKRRHPNGTRAISSSNHYSEF